MSSYNAIIFQAKKRQSGYNPTSSYIYISTSISTCVGCAPGTCKMLFHFHPPIFYENTLIILPSLKALHLPEIAIRW